MTHAPIGIAYIAWWGALEGGGETIGDLYALLRVAELAAAHCEEVVVLSKVAYAELGDIASVVADWSTLVPGQHDALIFVCGPIIQGSRSFRDLIARFGSCRKFGVGLSVLPRSSPDFWQPFDHLVARDGAAESVGDLAFSSRASSYVTNGPLGICLRGAQREYGLGMCMDQQAKELVDLAIAKADRSHLYLDTRLHEHPAAAQRILQEFAACAVVLTTRMHGCLLSLSLSVPCIGLDQIKGGAKVLAEATRLAWPAAWGADDSRAEGFLMDWPSHLEGLRRAIPSARASLDDGMALAERAVTAALARGGIEHEISACR